MAETRDKSLHDLAARIGEFPEEAYHFVREGLSYAVNRIHGPETPQQRALSGYLEKQCIDLSTLTEMFERGELSESVMAAIEQAGGLEKLNRHVSGGDMCWGLREYAHERWGLLARQVLESWNVRCTYDFGRLVFAMIEYDFMQKQPSDSIDDFANVFEFREALEQSYRVRLDGN